MVSMLLLWGCAPKATTVRPSAPPQAPLCAKEGEQYILARAVTIEALSQQTRALPELDAQGEVMGISLLSVRPYSTLATCGLQTGDIVRRVGGQPLGNAETSVAAYQAALQTGQFQVELTRNGRPLSLQIVVAEADNTPR